MQNLIQKTYLLSSNEWKKKTIGIINKITQNKNNLLISGGSTIKPIFRNIDIKKIEKKKIILGDERDVCLNSKNSNFNSIKKNLFKNKINKKKFVFFDIKKNKSKKKILNEYIDQIPKKIGASIFSFAKDGHVFSLFFNEKNFKKSNKRAFYTIKKKTFQDFPFLQKLLIVLNFILYYVKVSSAINFLSNKKKPKKVFLDTQKFLTNPTSYV